MMIEWPEPQSESEQKPKSMVTDNCVHSEWYYDSGGDLEILSSDGTLWKLAAYSLQASS